MKSLFIILAIVIQLIISQTIYSQVTNLQLKVGDKYLTGETGTMLYPNPDGSGTAIIAVPRKSIVKILDKGNNNNYHVEYNGRKGYIIDFAFGKNPISMNVDSRIKAFVESEINSWQKKGEFEKTIDFQRRVNEQTRDAKVKELTNLAINNLKEEYRKHISNSTFTLGEYDADNETFLILSNEFGNFVLKVPIENAKELKSYWGSTDFVNIDFYLKDSQFNIAKLDAYNRVTKKTFSFDSNVTTSYSITNLQYNFAPIEIEMGNQDFSSPAFNINSQTIIAGKSDINIDIPSFTKQNKNYFAVVIGNENYKNEIKVNYALYDARTVREYFNKTIGIPIENMHFVSDATYGQMLSEIEWLNNVTKAFNGNVRLFFYFAGHGVPDEQTKNAFLLPTDGNSSITQTAIKTEYLYDKLTQSQPELVTVFLDACFSGAAREGSLIEARGITVKPKEDILKGNIVVFSAATGDETAYPYNEKQHGLFTYYLLKMIKESAGNVRYAELSEYIKTNVKQQSIVLNQKNQNPRINYSPDLMTKWDKLSLR